MHTAPRLQNISRLHIFVKNGLGVNIKTPGLPYVCNYITTMTTTQRCETAPKVVVRLMFIESYLQESHTQTQCD